MKKKLLALICALALVFSLVGCTISAPDTVGSIGDFEITSGMYLLAQYGAYQQAAQLAGTDQDTTDVKAFLKETITTDSDSGETAVVSDYVAQKTQETLETLAAVDARFKALGGELTADQLSTADRYAQQMMDQYGDTYTANGIGLETVKAYERLQVEHTALLDMVYGPDGETPVEDDELTSHLDDSMYEICYISIPLYNTSTYAFADDDQKAEMLKLAQAAADSVNAAGGETGPGQGRGPAAAAAPPVRRSRTVTWDSLMPYRSSFLLTPSCARHTQPGTAAYCCGRLPRLPRRTRPDTRSCARPRHTAGWPSRR